MAEGLSPSEVGKEIAEHRKHTLGGEVSRHERIVTVIEAVLLAVVAVLAALSGYASAKWSTESRIKLAQASTARTLASSAELSANTSRNFDSSTFEAWFSAYVAGSPDKMAIAARRFRPEFRVAFDAWQATNPDTNPSAAPGPTFMPEYKQPDLERAGQLNQKADALLKEGSDDGAHGDDYVRATVYLATVLFLVGISGHFRLAGARFGLIAVAGVILVFVVSQLLVLPRPPT